MWRNCKQSKKLGEHIMQHDKTIKIIWEKFKTGKTFRIL